MSTQVYSLITVPEAKTYLKIGSDTSADTLLDIMINSISLAFERHCNRKLKIQQLIDEPCDGMDTQMLFLP